MVRCIDGTFYVGEFQRRSEAIAFEKRLKG
jgi:hypothetical protein